MMFNRIAWLVLATASGLTAGCGQGNSPTPGKTSQQAQKADLSVLEEGRKHLLDSEPAGSKGVIEVRKGSKDGDEVVVVGKVGGSTKPFTPDRASFLIVDPSLKPETMCDCPWDFCELPTKELAAARVNVKFVDGDGKTLKASARELFGIKELTTVVVKGKVARDDVDNVSIVARGIYVRKDKE
jgi:hypothetical protein